MPWLIDWRFMVLSYLFSIEAGHALGHTFWRVAREHKFTVMDDIITSLGLLLASSYRARLRTLYHYKGTYEDMKGTVR
jgi:hypothetical protein